MEDRRVVAVFAHPDDESFAAGGLLAWCARRGARVDVLTLTAGDGGTARDRGGSELGTRRRAELTAACAALGARPPVVLDLPDGRLDALPADALTAAIAPALADGADIVVTHAADGLYGHRDHIACRRAVLACATAADVGRVLAAEMPRGLLLPAWRALRRVRAIPIDRELRDGDLGIDAADADLRLDVRAERPAKLAAIAAHGSQLAGGDPLTFLRPGLVAQVLDDELYTVAAGAPLPAGATRPDAGLPSCASST